jgi:proteic killer suppression protein
MIEGFRCKETERVYLRRNSRRFSRIERVALRKLLMLDAAGSLEDLRVPPGNRLERLTGDRRGQYSIRINDQWRVCFRWEGGHARDVEIVDYH